MLCYVASATASTNPGKSNVRLSISPIPKALAQLQFLSLALESTNLRVRLANALLHSGSRRNAVNPLQEVREVLHLFLSEPTTFPTLDPWPGTDVCNGILALAVASEVFARLSGVFARELDLENAEDAEGFVTETSDGVYSSKRC